MIPISNFLYHPVFFRKDMSNIEPVEEPVEKREIDIMSRINLMVFIYFTKSKKSLQIEFSC